MRIESILGSKNRVRVLRALHTREGGSGRQVARLAGLSASAANVALTELVDSGFVLRSGTIGKHVYELNRDHALAESMGRLFTEEATLERRALELVRRHVRGMRRDLLGVGIEPDGAVTLALRPALPPTDPLLAPLRASLRSEMGMRLEACVDAPCETSFPGKWTRFAEEGGRRAGESATREDTLRFFGLQRKKV